MESLIVSVFVMALFTVLYTNVFPLIGQYERRENYDDIDSKYAAHWVRKMILDKGNSVALKNSIAQHGYSVLTSCDSTFFQDVTYCMNLREKMNIDQMVITSYNLTDVKEPMKSSGTFSIEFQDYLDYLPNYATDLDKQAYYRVIIEVDHGSYNYKTFGTIEVIM